MQAAGQEVAQFRHFSDRGRELCRCGRSHFFLQKNIKFFKIYKPSVFKWIGREGRGERLSQCLHSFGQW